MYYCCNGVYIVELQVYPKTNKENVVWNLLIPHKFLTEKTGLDVKDGLELQAFRIYFF